MQDKKMKVAFYLDRIKKGIDYRNPCGVNPGIGGTQFEIWEISYYLSQRDNGIDVILFAPKGADYCPSMRVVEVESVNECIQKSAREKVDYLILRLRPYRLPKTLAQTINESKVKIILWEHNFEIDAIECLVKKCPDIVGNVCVSHEQRDQLLDTDLYRMSHVIFNGIDFHDYTGCRKTEDKEKIVCYMGTLQPKSGYDDFLKAWRIVQKREPDAKLIIIGGPTLYELKKDPDDHESLKLKELENTILRNSEGELKSNIRFLGVLGGERKLNAMKTAMVGVANLTPAGETFGLSVVEFQALGIPVVSRNFRGLRDTVRNGKSGILVKDCKALADAIVDLLNHKAVCDEYGRFGEAYVRERFSIDLIIEEWERYLKHAEQAAESEIIDIRRYTYDRKVIIYLNYKLRKQIPCFPSHLRLVKIHNRIRTHFRRFRIS